MDILKIPRTKSLITNLWSRGLSNSIDDSNPSIEDFIEHFKHKTDLFEDDLPFLSFGFEKARSSDNKPSSIVIQKGLPNCVFLSAIPDYQQNWLMNSIIERYYLLNSQNTIILGIARTGLVNDSSPNFILHGQHYLSEAIDFIYEELSLRRSMLKNEFNSDIKLAKVIFTIGAYDLNFIPTDVQFNITNNPESAKKLKTIIEQGNDFGIGIMMVKATQDNELIPSNIFRNRVTITDSNNEFGYLECDVVHQAAMNEIQKVSLEVVLRIEKINRNIEFDDWSKKNTKSFDKSYQLLSLLKMNQLSAKQQSIAKTAELKRLLHCSVNLRKSVFELYQ
jgi:hypothetical protein